LSARSISKENDGYLNEFLDSLGGPIIAVAAYVFFATLSPRLRRNPLTWIVLIVITIGAIRDASEFIVMIPDMFGR
jgi:hypothetical protein